MFDIFWKRKPSEYATVYKWYEEKRDEVNDIRNVLQPFATAFSNSGGEADSTFQLAVNARDLLKASTATIKQQAREIEQLTEQMDALRQQQIMLTTTTPTAVKPKSKPRVTGAKP